MSGPPHLDLFGNKESVQEFLQIYSIDDPDHFYKNPMHDGAKIKYRYVCWKYLLNIRDKRLPEIKLNNKLEAAFIEFRCFPHVEFLIRNAIIKLGAEWSQTIVCGNKNYDYMKNMCDKISPNIKLIKLDVDNLDPGTSYTNLLTSVSFWNMFSGEKILIHQEDSCIFKTNYKDFLQYDYIGAPWNHHREWYQESGLKIPVGNGGFSLRTKQIMIDIINKYERSPNDVEDVYFARQMQDNNIGNFPDGWVAQAFSAEAILSDQSFGGHCFFHYDTSAFGRFVTDCVMSLYEVPEIVKEEDLNQSQYVRLLLYK